MQIYFIISAGKWAILVFKALNVILFLGNYCPKKSVLFSRSHFFFIALSFLPTLPYPTHSFFLYDCLHPLSSSVAMLLAVFTLFIWLPLFLFFFIGNAVVAIHIFYMIAFSPSFPSFLFSHSLPSPYQYLFFSGFLYLAIELFLSFPSKASCDLFFYCLLLQTCNLFDWKLGNNCPKRCSVKSNI